MSASEMSLKVPGYEVRRFVPYDSWDRNFFLLWAVLYLGNDILVIGLGAYDWVPGRRRLLGH